MRSRTTENGPLNIFHPIRLCCISCSEKCTYLYKVQSPGVCLEPSELPADGQEHSEL